MSCNVLDDYGSIGSMCIHKVIKNDNGFEIGLTCFCVVIAVLLYLMNECLVVS